MQRIKDILEPQPSLAIVKFWQGIGDIVLRSLAIVVCCLTFICAAVVSTHTAFPNIVNNPNNLTFIDLQSLRDSTHGLAGWVIFACIVGVVYEGIAIAFRFLNMSIVDKYIGFMLITDIVIHVIFALFGFIEGIIFAVFGGTHWVSLEARFPSVPVDYPSIESSCRATAVFLMLFGLPVYTTLAVWIGVWLFARWQQIVARILRNQAGPTDRDTEDLDPSQDDF